MQMEHEDEVERIRRIRREWASQFKSLEEMFAYLQEGEKRARKRGQKFDPPPSARSGRSSTKKVKSSVKTDSKPRPKTGRRS
ncbi:MAG TPA: hypothetical protein VEK08_05300 [Planctomycetota bacterium]|nr:hypothetical protein [Planctomycetota bacterium]